MLTGNLSYTIYQGQDWCETVYIQDGNNIPVQLSGYTFSGIIKRGYGVSGYIGLMDCSVTSGATGYLHLSISATGTAAIPATWGVYSVRAYQSGVFIEEFLKGNFYVYPDIFSIN